MDFILASFPWLITWGLDMRRVEKIGLCVTMSLGMVVAIVAAIRTGWKDGGNPKDEWYFSRNAHSNIWFSSEIVGTIIVQCIPVLRPLLRDIRTSFMSKKYSNVEPNRRNRYVSLEGCAIKRILTCHRIPSPFGLSSSHQASAYSDAKQATATASDTPIGDSWDNQGIYQKKDFELTTMHATEKSATSPV
jgi:hypothetical protein